mmetsp:Transcript_33400/g.56583  ORF Transcript_33400/g.56583 Transcript_33400/m.56583 type:complete len:520 (-) Transcript_33400:264-1823(-)
MLYPVRGSWRFSIFLAEVVGRQHQVVKTTMVTMLHYKFALAVLAALALLFFVHCPTSSAAKSYADGSAAACGGGDDTCPDSSSSTKKSKRCLHPSDFQHHVASLFDNESESVLTLLRGTVDKVISNEDANELVELLPLSDFVESSGYETDNKDRAQYTAPVAYAGLGLKELSTTNEERYTRLLQIREKIRSATESSLNLCPGSLKIDYTTIAQKTEGGAHRAHADNCVHYFDDRTKTAVCDPSRQHPYPKRVAASILYLNDPADGNFNGGEFYFANRTHFGEVEDSGRVAVETGKMIYFTSGVENLHGALKVERDSSSEQDGGTTIPRRLAIAMWYVFDESLEEFVPTFQASEEEATSSLGGLKPRKVYDPNDPNAPKELFTLSIPDRIDISSLFQSAGAYLVSQQNKPLAGSWTISQYGEDTLHVLFKDHSAMFSLDFGVALIEATSHAKASVVVERYTDGSRAASLQYMLQESVLLHGLLDYLSNVILNESSGGAEEEYVGHEMEKARDTLPARRAS